MDEDGLDLTTKLKYVPFRKWRIFWFSLYHARKSGIVQSTNPDLSAAHKTLAMLGNTALVAINSGIDLEFVRALELHDGIQK